MDGFPDERVHRSNAEGRAGLVNRTVPQRPRRLAPDQSAALAAWVEADPDPARDGVVRWRRRDLARTASRPSSASSCTSAVLASNWQRWVSGGCRSRPQHPKSDPEAQAAFKKTSPKP